MRFKAIITFFWVLGSAQEVAEIRLVGGPDDSKCEGRVEIKQDEPGSQFGQACDLNARDMEAEVVCRQLGCNPVGAKRVEPVQYGFSSKVDRYVAFGFDCTGKEHNLNDCWEPGAAIRFDDPRYAVAVRCGPGKYDPTSEPHPPPHREPEPKSPTKLKLDGGRDGCEGRLLVEDRQDYYIPACCCDVHREEVMVICRQLGCGLEGARRIHAKPFKSPNYLQNVDDKYFLDNVCNGTESNIDECHEPKRTCSRNRDPVQKGFEDIAIRCGNPLPEASSSGDTSQYTGFMNSLGIILAILIVVATFAAYNFIMPQKDEKPRFSKHAQDKLVYDRKPDPQPDGDSQEHRELVLFSEQVKIILQVVNENEYQAAITILEPPSGSFPKAVVFPSPGKVVGMLGKHKTALIHTDVGSKATDYIQDGLDKFPAARFVIGVGVAYALDRSKCKLGDVLVSKTISNLENIKFDGGKVIDRGETIDVVKSITSIFCKGLMFKEPYVVSSNGRTAKVHGRTAKVHSGKIISYTALLNSKEMRDKIHAALHEPIGGEMEGGQLLQFQKKNKVEGIVVVKGVSDYADGKKSKEWQFTASLAALNYVKDKLSYLAPS